MGSSSTIVPFNHNLSRAKRFRRLFGDDLVSVHERDAYGQKETYVWVNVGATGDPKELCIDFTCDGIQFDCSAFDDIGHIDLKLMSRITGLLEQVEEEIPYSYDGQLLIEQVEESSRLRAAKVGELYTGLGEGREATIIGSGLVHIATLRPAGVSVVFNSGLPSIHTAEAGCDLSHILEVSEIASEACSLIPRPKL